MNIWYHVMRGSEIMLALAGTYLAVKSFLGSSLYRIINEHVLGPIFTDQVSLIHNPSLIELIPIILGSLAFLTVLFNYMEGKPENVTSIYELNLILIIPETLSFSKLNWLNLVDLEELMEPTRGFTSIFFTGVIILFGYTLALSMSRDRETIKELEERGVNQDDINDIITKKTILNLATVSTSTMTTLLIAGTVPIIHNALNPITPKLPHNYITFGLTASLIIVTGIILYLKNRIEKPN
jgi:hypothetical protein